MHRLLLSFFASKYVKLITGLPIHDTTSGFKCYRRRVLEKINYRKFNFQGYGFQIAMKYQAWKADFILKEIPIVFTERSQGQSKMHYGIIKEAISFLKDKGHPVSIIVGPSDGELENKFLEDFEEIEIDEWWVRNYNYFY